MKFSFNHIALAVRDVTESMNFYQSIFKLKEIKNTASSSKTRWLLLDATRQLHIIPRPDAEIKTAKAVHFALATNDFDRFVRHLISLDILFYDWVGAPNTVYVRDDGIRQLYFQDPNGYWIEVNDDV